MSHPTKDCAFCGDPFTPRAYTQRFCAEACRVRMPWVPRNAPTPKQPELSAIERSEREMRTRWVVSDWALEQRRPRSMALWGACLGVNLEAA
jgi:hypothetical protein